MKLHPHASKAAAPPSQSTRWWLAAFLWLSLPAALIIMVLGGFLEASFVKRRHESTFRWLLFMAARFLAPILIIVVCIAFFYKHLL